MAPKIILLVCTALSLHAAPGKRLIPQPLASHPGNIFLSGEDVVITLPAGQGETWRATDYEGKLVAEGRVEGGPGKLGRLPVGYYEVVRKDGTNFHRVTLGVLEPLAAPTPENSPIAIDVAMAWFFPKERMSEPANLCALAGINWVRDRLLWSELEPKRGEFALSTRYDASAQAQMAAGLKVLQVGHASASWANPNTKRFPLDLRDIYNFYRQMAQRWRGSVLAFEPWNEADISMFGGHTGSEMASLQKAAYLGLKAGDPEITACLNVFAIHRPATLQDFDANAAWPYFDTFNLHHYEPLQAYPKLYADFRAVSGGKPLWVTECSVRVKWTGEEQLKELSDEDLRWQSERVTKTYTLALYQGAAQVFYFMLPQYSEGQVQFGLLHADLTPRPGYLALAAVGRLLADAKPLGRVALPDMEGQAYFFSTSVGGKSVDVAVVWSQRETSFELPATPTACFDHLGRPVPVSGKVLNVRQAPLYAILANGALPKLLPPPKPAPLLPGKAVPVVLQALLPEGDTVLDKSAYKVPAGLVKTIPVFLYNFAPKKTSGRLTVSAPAQWKAAFPAAIELAPGERKELALELTCPSASAWTEAETRISADFGSEGQSVLSFRLVPE
jgi:hypothetical protein